MTVLENLHNCAMAYNEEQKKKKYKRSELSAKRNNEKHNDKRRVQYQSDPKYREMIKQRSREYYHSRNMTHRKEHNEEYDKVYAESAKKNRRLYQQKKNESRGSSRERMLLAEINAKLERGEQILPTINFEKIPEEERAKCMTPWCMNFTNGHCIHRTCVVESRRYTDVKKEGNWKPQKVYNR